MADFKHTIVRRSRNLIYSQLIRVGGVYRSKYVTPRIKKQGDSVFRVSRFSAIKYVFRFSLLLFLFVDAPLFFFIRILLFPYDLFIFLLYVLSGTVVTEMSRNC
jgi:hypothetical protein